MQIDFESLANEMVADVEQNANCRNETWGTLRMRTERELPVMQPKAKRLSPWRVLAAVGISTPTLLGLGCGILAHAQAEAVRRQQALLAAPIARHAVIHTPRAVVVPALPPAEINVEPAHAVAHARAGRALPRAAAAETPAPAPMVAAPAPPSETLSPSAIQKGLAGVRDRVRSCKSQLPPEATVVNAEVVIGRDGTVSEVGVEGVGVDSATKCLEQAISEAQFPAFTGEPKIVRYPFTLK